MFNYKIDPAVLQPFVPAGTELDQWQGNTYASLVGFLFLDTRIKGYAIPFHQNFEEVNLRFYVKRHAATETRRGVVFIKEIVPRFAIAALARLLYNENYISLPMQHTLNLHPGCSTVEYRWSFNGQPQHMRAQFADEPRPLETGSQEEFITEHYWGYTAQRDGGTIEYQVQHPPWKVWSAKTFGMQIDCGKLYGAAFEPFLNSAPVSVFVAEGSPVSVSKGMRL